MSALIRSDVALAAGWKQAWLGAEARLRGLQRRNEGGAMLPFEELHAGLEQMRSEVVALRARISCDVVDHLAVKKEPPQGTPAASPARTARSHLTVCSTPWRRLG